MILHHDGGPGKRGRQVMGNQELSAYLPPLLSFLFFWFVLCIAQWCANCVHHLHHLSLSTFTLLRLHREVFFGVVPSNVSSFFYTSITSFLFYCEDYVFSTYLPSLHHFPLPWGLFCCFFLFYFILYFILLQRWCTKCIWFFVKKDSYMPQACSDGPPHNSWFRTSFKNISLSYFVWVTVFGMLPHVWLVPFSF